MMVPELEKCLDNILRSEPSNFDSDFSKTESEINKLNIKEYTNQDIQDIIEYALNNKLYKQNNIPFEHSNRNLGFFLSVIMNKTKGGTINVKTKGLKIDYLAYQVRNKTINIQDENTGDSIGRQAENTTIIFEKENTGNWIVEYSQGARITFQEKNMGNNIAYCAENTTITFEKENTGNNIADYAKNTTITFQEKNTGENTGNHTQNTTILTKELEMFQYPESFFQTERNNRIYYLTTKETQIPQNCIKIPEQLAPEQIIRPETVTTKTRKDEIEYEVINPAIIKINDYCYILINNEIERISNSDAYTMSDAHTRGIDISEKIPVQNDLHLVY